MLSAIEPEGLPESFFSLGQDFSTSKDKRDCPKYLYMRVDFWLEVFEIPESDEDAASVKLSLVSSFAFRSIGFFLCRISDVNTMRMMTANVAPDPIAMRSRSPCDSPSIDTLGTLGKENQ